MHGGQDALNDKLGVECRHSLVSLVRVAAQLSSVGLDIGVVNLGQEYSVRSFERIVRRKSKFDLECPFCIGGVRKVLNINVSNVVIFRVLLNLHTF